MVKGDKTVSIPVHAGKPVPTGLLHRLLKQQDGGVTAFNEKLWCGLPDYATAYADGRLMFTFKNGSTFEG